MMVVPDVDVVFGVVEVDPSDTVDVLPGVVNFVVDSVVDCVDDDRVVEVDVADVEDSCVVLIVVEESFAVVASVIDDEVDVDDNVVGGLAVEDDI